MPMCTIGSHDLCDSTHLRPSWGLQGNNSFYEAFLNFCSNCQRSSCNQETLSSLTLHVLPVMSGVAVSGTGRATGRERAGIQPLLLRR